MSGLSVEGLQVERGGVTVLSGVNLSTAPGTVTGLIGPNGAGKSTLIASIIGLAPSSSGTIAFGGLDLRTMRASDRAKRLAHVEQSATTSERLSVRDVVALGRIPYQSTWAASPSPADDAIVDAVIAELDLQAFAGRLYQSLSGGEQQRVHLARALAQEPTLLLLDEPTSHLDIEAQLLVLALLRRRAVAGCTVLVALHDLNLAARFCDHLVMLDHGRVAATGTPTEVLTTDLLRSVYRVSASIIALPGRTHPLVVYDDALPAPPMTKSD